MSIRILTGDALTMLRGLPDASVHCCVTSPPYFGLRDYGMDGQIGLEDTPDAFVARLVDVFRGVRRVLRDDGTLWLNIGDSYGRGARVDNVNDGKRGTNAHAAVSAASAYASGPRAHMREKDLIGIPWRLAFALQSDGWYLRQDIIWHKPNPMPESVTDRCTKSHEYVFLLSKSPRYFYDADAIKEHAVAADLGAMDGGAQRKADGSNANGGRNFRGHLPGNKTHKGATAYANGAEEHRTKEGLVRYSSKVAADPSQMLSRNKRSVWSITTQPFSEAHFATMAPELAETCIKAGCLDGGTVLDPFGGAGTTALVADRLGRDAILIELNPAYVEIARKRLTNDAGMFAEVA